MSVNLAQNALAQARTIACYFPGGDRRSFQVFGRCQLHLHRPSPQQIFWEGRTLSRLLEGTMFRAGLRSTWGAISRPAPTNPWQTFFRTNLQKRTLINSSRDNHWPRSPILPEGKGFNWDAFRWTNYRVASTLLPGVWLM